MTQEERNQLATQIAYTAQYYGKEYRKEVLAMMVSDLEDLPAPDVINALNTYRRDPKNRFFPLPAQLRDLITPTKTKDAEAREILGRIKESVGLFGYMSGNLVMEYVGPIGWRFIQEAGGWYYLCAETNFTNDPAFLAQARERLIDMVRFGAPLRSVDRPQVSHEEKIQLEKQRQVAVVDDWKTKIERSKPDPNKDYLSMSKEEQSAFMKDFIARANAKERGDRNG